MVVALFNGIKVSFRVWGHNITEGLQRFYYCIFLKQAKDILTIMTLKIHCLCSYRRIKSYVKKDFGIIVLSLDLFGNSHHLFKHKRILDIFIREWNTVIEFQHSKIDVEDFVGRTLFYLKQGIKVVWLYDMTSYTEKGEFIFAGRSDNYCWYIMDKKIYVQVFEIWDRILQLGKNQMCFFHIYQKNGQYEFYNKVEVIFQNQGDLIEAMVGPVYHPALRECQKSPYSFGRFYQPVVLTKYSIFSKLSKLSNIRINDLK